MIAGAGDVLANYLERTVVTYPHALLITPIGIAKAAGSASAMSEARRANHRTCDDAVLHGATEPARCPGRAAS
jgi:glycerol dehydrogenase-like iron-containing ADH family enzyme